MIHEIIRLKYVIFDLDPLFFRAAIDSVLYFVNIFGYGRC